MYQQRKEFVMSDLYTRQSGLGLDTTKSVTVVGCGGIGYWVGKFLAMSGVENIYLFDPDTFEEHNLNRIDIGLDKLGINKAVVTKDMILSIRPECTVRALPFIMQEHTFPKTDWVLDCTDKIKSQLENQRIAEKYNSKYVKAGYNGESMSISDSVAEWGEAEDGYTIIPSWVVPASIVAGMVVAKMLKYNNCEMGLALKEIFNYKSVKGRK